MIELSRHNGNLNQAYGGDTLNTAVYLARQLQKSHGTVRFVTGLGRDPFSTSMIQSWAEEGIKTDLIVRSESLLPGLYFIETTPEGERSFYYWRGESAARVWINGSQGDEVCGLLMDMDVLYASGISLAILNEQAREKLFSLFRVFRSRGGRVIFDNNFRPRLWASQEEARRAYEQMLSCTDVAFLTLDDEDALWGGTADMESLRMRCTVAGISEVIIKRGAAACIVIHEGQEFNIDAIPVPEDRVVDTTAAGDSFSAGYLACRLQGGDVCESARQGHILASRVIQHPGAIIPKAAMPVSEIIQQEKDK